MSGPSTRHPTIGKIYKSRRHTLGRLPNRTEFLSLKNKINTLIQERDELRDAIDSVEDALGNIRNRNTELVHDNNALRSQVQSMRNSVKSLRDVSDELCAAQVELVNLREVFEQTQRQRDEMSLLCQRLCSALTCNGTSLPNVEESNESCNKHADVTDEMNEQSDASTRLVVESCKTNAQDSENINQFPSSTLKPTPFAENESNFALSSHQNNKVFSHCFDNFCFGPMLPSTSTQAHFTEKNVVVKTPNTDNIYEIGAVQTLFKDNVAKLTERKPVKLNMIKLFDGSSNVKDIFSHNADEEQQCEQHEYIEKPLCTDANEDSSKSEELLGPETDLESDRDQRNFSNQNGIDEEYHCVTGEVSSEIYESGSLVEESDADKLQPSGDNHVVAKLDSLGKEDVNKSGPIDNEPEIDNSYSTDKDVDIHIQDDGKLAKTEIIPSCKLGENKNTKKPGRHHVQAPKCCIIQ